MAMRQPVRGYLIVTRNSYSRALHVRCFSTQANQQSTSGTNNHHKIVIVGGGCGGIAMASHLAKAGHKGVIIDPAKYHYYQPAWTLVGGGEFNKEDTRKELKDLVPSGFSRVDESVAKLDPDQNRVVTESGSEISYDYLVVAAGLDLKWDAIKGLKQALGSNGVCSNYSYENADDTWDFTKKFKGGTAIFTQPSTPIKCGGAPQKAMYLSEDTFRDNKVRDKTEVKFFSGGAALFPSKFYADKLWDIARSRNIEPKLQHDLVEVKAEEREAVFRTPDGQLKTEKYDMLHVVPPMGPPAFIKNSPLADKTLGWVDVNKHTLQHNKYSNVFALGDCSSLPTSKTAAAISNQAPVAAGNLIRTIEKKPLTFHYDGYTSCPIVTGHGKLLLAEFDYTLAPRPTFGRFLDQNKERKDAFYLKKFVMPILYWQGLLKARWNTFKNYELAKST